ncbi:MAG TPA: CHAT domain-containing protein [Anaerolineales bacterium]|nr:CHAT domain-containing protein [Anaerolineales bacterium]
MAEISYLDFDMMIERTGEKTYRARVLSSPAGQASGEITLPFSDLELENFLLKIGRTRRGVRRLESPEMEAAKVFGGRLFKAVFDDEVFSALRSSLDEARKQRQGLRIRLRLNDAPELVNLPWEYLYNPSLNRFLSLSVNTPLIRYLELPERISPLPVSLPLRVLAVISSPSDYPGLDVEREWNNLNAALADLIQRGVLLLDRLETATPTALQYSLRRNEYHIFHFIGHGGFNEQAQDGILLFEEEGGRGRPLSGQYLGTLLHDEDTLRLAVLNACEGGRSGMSDPFAGVAQSLVQQGLPAVIGMQFEVTDQAAITFAREFYTAIADGYPVDAALSEARKAIFSLGNDIEWGTPVLYMRAPDGMIFDVSKLPETAQEPQPAAEAIPHSHPPAEGEQISAPERAVEAGPKPDIEQLYEDGLSAFWEKDWNKAWELFRQVVEIDPNYRDTPAMLGQTRTQVLLSKLYEQAGSLHQEQKWAEIITIFEQIHALDKDYPDPDKLLPSAQSQLAEEERKRKVQDLYSQAMAAMHAQHWQEAYNLFSQVAELEPDYYQTQRMLERASAEIKASAAPQTQEQAVGATRVSTRPAEAASVSAPPLTSVPAARKGLPRSALLAFGGVALLAIAVIIYLVIKSLITDNANPLISEVRWNPNPVLANSPMIIMAVIDDSSTGNSPIQSAEYSLDFGATWSPMQAQDGAFDEASELVIANPSAPGDAGEYGLCVRGYDQKDNSDEAPCTSLNVLPVTGKEGPKVLDDIVTDPTPAITGMQVTFMATVESSEPGATPIALVEYSLDGGDSWSAMQAQDGTFDQPRELATISTLAPEQPSTYILCVRAIDSNSNKGQPRCIPLIIEQPPIIGEDTPTPTHTPTQLPPHTPTPTASPTPPVTVATNVNKVIYGDADGNPLGFFIQVGRDRWVERKLDSNDTVYYTETRRDSSSIYLQETMSFEIQLDLKREEISGDAISPRPSKILTAEILKLPSDPVEFVENYWRNVSEKNYAQAWASLSHSFRVNSVNRNDFSLYKTNFEKRNYCRINTRDARLVEQKDGQAIVAVTVIYFVRADCVEAPYKFNITLTFDETLQDWLYEKTSNQ